MQTDSKRWGYTPTGYILTQQDWQDAVPGVGMQPPHLRDWMDILLAMAPAGRTSDYREVETCRQIR